MFSLFPKFEAGAPDAVIHWMEARVVLTCLNYDSSGTIVEASHVIAWNNDDERFSDPDRLGAYFAAEVSRSGLSIRRAVVSVRRQGTMVRAVDLGKICSEEVARAVALHVEGLEHSLNRELAWDFLVHRDESSSGQLATLVTCPANVINGIADTLTAAGIEVTGCVLGELALGSLQESAGDHESCFVLANEQKLDVVLLRNGRPLTALATRMPESADASAAVVRQLVDRMQSALPQQLAIGHIDHFSVVGMRAVEVGRELKALGIGNVSLIDSQHPRDSIALAIGNTVVAQQPLPDLLHPTLPPDERRLQQVRWVKRGLVAASVAAAAVIGVMIWHQLLQSELTIVTARCNNAQAVLDHAAPAVRKWEYLSDWESQAIKVPEELTQLSALLPDAERVFLTRLQIEDVPGHQAPMLRVDGLAKGTTDVMALNRALLDANYSLRPHAIEPAGRDKQFRSQFQVEATRSQTDAPNDG